MLLCACGGDKTNAYAAAEALYERIEKAVEAGEYSQAISLTDSLDSAYTSAVDIRRKAMPLRAKALEGVALQRIPQIDAELAGAMSTIEQYGPAMTKVGEGTDYYMVPATWPDIHDVKTSGLEPRVDSNALFRIVLKNNGKPIALNALSIVSGGNTISTPGVDASRVATLGDSEMLSLNQEESAPLIEWLRRQTAAPALKATLSGVTGSKDVSMTNAMAVSMIHAWDFAMAQQKIFELTNERARLERQLQIARDQQARLH